MLDLEGIRYCSRLSFLTFWWGKTDRKGPLRISEFGDRAQQKRAMVLFTLCNAVPKPDFLLKIKIKNTLYLSSPLCVKAVCN